MMMAALPTVWWWRRNPLARRIDVVEKWLLLVAWLCATAGSLLTGLVAGIMTNDGLDEQLAGQHSVQAVVLKETPARASAVSSGGLPVVATVRWTGTDGAPRTGRTGIEAGVAVGSRTTVWTDGHGRLMSRPLSQTQVALDAGVVGTAAAVGTASVVLGGAWTVHQLLNRCRMRQWDRDWEQADIRWSGRTP
ncbi:Rv1733c family protein [Streptomyces brasiliensis]|uniref:Transmembrane protein n=2 Tax=Streptomyces brasiliensis TaxID=1954 RepID=A0A917UPW9_9ACTN|nr:hypothetical protein GCM10010121_100360 [Streptomyces brasiliensis]